jgi:hypothetical protein
MRRRALAALSVLPLLPIHPAASQSSTGADPGGAMRGSARGRAVLRVSGALGQPGEADFDLAELEALGATTLATRTAWTGDATPSFTGLPLARLLEAVRAGDGDLRAVALNDYAVTVPREDAARHGAFLATRQDGVPLRIRDRGPIWLIYPWSARPELDTPAFRNRAIWQLRQIHVG